MRAWNRKKKPKHVTKPKWSYFPSECIYSKIYTTLNFSTDKSHNCHYLNSFMVKRYFPTKEEWLCRSKNFL